MRPIHLAICLMTILCTGAAFAQEAYVYDTVAKGTYVYDASSTGKLTLIKGSPFRTVGALIGTNGKYFVTAASADVYSYAVESNGSIGKLVSTINTQLYSGHQCGTIGGNDFNGSITTPGVFDHTGQNIYVTLAGAEDDDGDLICYGVQTYGISKAGILTFKGTTEYSDNINIENGPSHPTIAGNGKFSFDFQKVVFDNVCGPGINTFAAETGGVLNYLPNAGINFPTLSPGAVEWVLMGAMADDPTDHLAMAVYTTTDGDCENSPIFGPAQLASFTVDSQGNLTSTNTYANMPQLALDDYPTAMTLDYTGKILAVAVGTGIQFFHFNGAEPITPFTGIIGLSGYFTQMSWDADGHLYAQNGASGRMHVYEATTKSVKELSGSPTVISQGTFVVRTK